MKDYTTVRHAYRLAVIDEEGNALTGREMLAKLKEPIWDGVPFAELIPELEKMPPTHIKIEGILQPNLAHAEAVARNEQRCRDYLAILQKQYTWQRLVLQAYNTRLGWWTVEEPDNQQWMGFALSTILLRKNLAIRKLCKL